MKTTLSNILGLIREGRADPRIRDIAVRVIRSADIAATDYQNIIQAMAKFVRQNVRFVRDPPRTDQVFPALEVLNLGGADCLTGDNEIICFKDGLYKIKMIGDPDIINYQALSYNLNKEKFEFKSILSWWDKGERSCWRVHLRNGTYFECTKDHKLFNFARSRAKIEIRTLSEIYELTTKLKDKSYYNQIMIAKKLPACHYEEAIQQEKLWLFGHYIAEGWHTQGKTEISGEIKKITSNLTNLKVPFTVQNRGTSSSINIRKSPLKKELANLGNNAFDKFLPEKYISLPREKLLQFLKGYADGDGYINPKRRNCTIIYNTSSSRFSDQLRLIHLILGRPLCTWYQYHHGGSGRHPIWRLYELTKAHYGKELMRDVSKVTIKEITPLEHKRRVFDIEVSDNHNFVLAKSGIIAHNCEDHTVLAASLLESIGLPVAVVIVSKTGRLWDHVFLRAGYPPDRPVNGISVDTTIFPPWGREIPYVDERICEVS